MDTEACSQTTSRHHPLIVGLGNPFAADDSLGIVLARRLSLFYPEYDFAELPQAGPTLLDLLNRGEPILFIDAISSGSPAGTVRLLPLPSSSLESRTLSAVSSHGWNLGEVLALRRALGQANPPIALLGIELEDATAGTELTPAVERAVDLVVLEFPGYLHRAFECDMSVAEREVSELAS